MHTTPPRSPTQMEHHAAMIDAAKARAGAMRREAMNDLWDGLGDWGHRGLDTGQRAAQRLAHRLHQHLRRAWA